MAITAETRTGIITLSVAMLGSAPGTDQLAEWIEAVSEGMSLDDLANHIAASSEFRAVYGLTTNEEFASLFLSNVFDGEVSADIQTLAEGLVVAMLNDGMSRGSLALALASALHDMSDMDHPAYGDFGMAAANLANKAEVAEYYALEAKMEDPSGAVLEGVTSDMATVARAKHDIDSPPADAMFNDVGELSIMENAPSGMVGSVTAADHNSTADYPEPVTYSLKDAPEGFEINSATGEISYMGDGLDHEMADKVGLTVVATSIGASGMPTHVEKMVYVMVGDVQESDAAFNDVGMLSIDENAAMGNVGSVTATDAEGEDVTYRFGEGAPEGFSIDSATGAISYSGDGIDYEDTQSVELTVIATSIGANNMATDVPTTVTVSVNDAMERAAMFSEPDGGFALSLEEHATSGSVGSVTAADADGDDVMYSLGEGAAEGFSINADGEISYSGAGINYEDTASVNLTVVASSYGEDGREMQNVSQDVTVQITNLRDAEFDDYDDLALKENTSGATAAVAVGTVSASDADEDTVSYRLAGPAVNSDNDGILHTGFEVDSATGAITYTGNGILHSVSKSVDLEVIATSRGDNGMDTDVSKMVTIDIVSRVNAVFGAIGEFSIDENTLTAAIGTVNATDADGDAVSYSLADDSPAGFSIDSATGAISYAGDGLDHETMPMVSLTVVATSIGIGGEMTPVEAMVEVAVNDVQESDAVFDAVAALSIDENEPAGMVGSVTASDAEGDDVTYSLAEDSPAGFAIDPASGEISYSGDVIDYEMEQTVDLTVIATSTGANNEPTPVSEMVTVNINNLNDNAPMVGEAMGENSLHASTPEADMPTGLSFSVTDADESVGEYSAMVYEGEGEDMAVSTRFKAVADESDSMSFNIVAIGGAALAAGEVSLTVKASDGMHDSEAQMVSFTIGEAPAPVPVPGDVFNLTRSRDNIQGTDDNDTIISDPDANGLPTLNSFDSINGGDGWDILQIFDIEPSENIGEGGALEGGLEIDSSVDALVENVEEVYIHARGGIVVDLTEWEGLEKLELGRFGRVGDVDVTVDGASVETTRTFRGDVTVGGAGGELSLEASSDSTVKVGSGEHTTSVMVKGGKIVDVSGNGKVGSAASQSMSVTSVTIDGVKGEDLGGDRKRGTTMEAVGVTIFADNAIRTPAADMIQYVTADGTEVANGATGYYEAANQEPAGDHQVVVTTETDEARMILTRFDSAGKRVAPGAEGYGSAKVGTDSEVVPVHIYSDAIESVALHNTYATVAVVNKSKEAEDLMVTVNEYGTAAIVGKLCLTGDGTAENVDIMVAGNSNFILAGNATKTVDVALGADLKLGVTKFQNPNPDMPSETLESIMLSGTGKFEMDANGLSKLATIDASGASGEVVINNVGSSVTSYMGNSGSDRLHVSGYNSKEGVMIELGAGDDVFTSGAGNGKSRVDGGAGMDTLKLTGNSTTHKVDGKDVSIFSNFETLDVGGSGEATHNIDLLGVHAITVSASTTSAVTLNEAGDGMGITVNGKAGMAAVGTDATIVHNLKARSAGDPRYSGEFNVVLTANGSKGDTATAGTGAASLKLTTDEEIEILNIESRANPADKGVGSAYRNKLILMGADDEADSPSAVVSSVEAIVVSGNAAATVSFMQSAGTGTGDAQFVDLELIDAEGNTGGVTFDANIWDDDGTITASLSQKLEMVGGSGGDMFTGGSGVDELMGNGGVDTLSGGAEDDIITGGADGDMLTGGTGDDTFKYSSASESQVVFDKNGMSGFDTITDFGTGTTVIALGKTLYESLGGTVLVHTEIIGTDNDDAVDATGDEEDTTLDNLKVFLDSFKDKDGVFESRGDPVVNAINDKGPLIEHSVATVVETYWMKRPVADDPDTTDNEAFAGQSATRTWLLIDVDGDGDFNAATDMAIALTDRITVTNDNLDA